MIYAAEILDNKFVKIGFSDGPDASRRIASLQTGCPFQIKPLFVIPGTLRQEQSLHAALSVAFGRIRIPMPPNEWYPGRNPFFAEFLANLRLGFDVGLAHAEKFNPSVRQSGQAGARSTEPNIKWPLLKESKGPS